MGAFKILWGLFENFKLMIVTPLPIRGSTYAEDVGKLIDLPDKSALTVKLFISMF